MFNQYTVLGFKHTTLRIVSPPKNTRHVVNLIGIAPTIVIFIS